MGIRERDSPGEHWELDFTEAGLARFGYLYLLVVVDTFSEWVEVVPTRSKTAM